MKASDIVNVAMKMRGYNQTMLAAKSGLKRQSNVSQMLRGKSMRVDNFLRLMTAMDFEVIVQDKTTQTNYKCVITADVEETSISLQPQKATGSAVKEAKTDVTAADH